MPETTDTLFSSKNIVKLTFAQAVKKRPYMYIGKDCILELFKGLIIDIIEICKTDEITFEITILGNNDFIFEIKTEHNLKLLLGNFLSRYKHYNNYYFPRVLKVISTSFNIKTEDQKKLEIRFSLDKKIITNPNIDYIELSKKIIEIAVLNPKIDIIIIDKRQKYINRNYYHFPQGIFYLFDKIIDKIVSKPEFIFTFDGKINDNAYQIGLAYRTDKIKKPSISSSANSVNTVHGGSLVDGVIDGLVDACRAYFKENNSTTFKINRKKLMSGLILICAVRGQNFSYGGSFKGVLDDETVRKEATDLVAGLALDFFKMQKEKSEKVLERFNTISTRI